MCKSFGAKAALRSSRFTFYAPRAPSDPIVSSCVRLLLLFFSPLGNRDAASPRAPFVVPLTFTEVPGLRADLPHYLSRRHECTTGQTLESGGEGNRCCSSAGRLTGIA